MDRLVIVKPAPKGHSGTHNNILVEIFHQGLQVTLKYSMYVVRVWESGQHSKIPLVLQGWHWTNDLSKAAVLLLQSCLLLVSWQWLSSTMLYCMCYGAGFWLRPAKKEVIAGRIWSVISWPKVLSKSQVKLLGAKCWEAMKQSPFCLTNGWQPHFLVGTMWSHPEHILVLMQNILG